MSRNRTSGNVEYGAGLFASDLEHIGDHQEQTLARREGGGERTGLQRAVNSSGRSAFRLHLAHNWSHAPDVLFR